MCRESDDAQENTHAVLFACCLAVAVILGFVLGSMSVVVGK